VATAEPSDHVVAAEPSDHVPAAEPSDHVPLLNQVTMCHLLLN
jgi:hypothetical protein